MKNIVIITRGHFPEGDAGATRLLYLSKALTQSGFHVTVLCRGRYGNGNIDGIEFISFREKSPCKPAKLAAYLLFPFKVKHFLRHHPEKNNIFFYYDIPLEILRFCKRGNKKAKLFFDCIEWHSPEQFRWKRFDPGYIYANHVVTQTIDSSFKVTAITQYLEQYFRNKEISAMRVPMLCDALADPITKIHSHKLHIFYAGSPQSKDLVGNLLEAALLLTPQEQKQLRITLVGSTREQLMKNCGISGLLLDACSDFLELHGRKSRDEVLQMLVSADFVQLIRNPEMRYAQAGFPSKVVESLAHSTPIFCNLSSDLGLYLRDGENALIADSHKPEDLAVALRRGLALSPKQKDQMAIAAFETAKKHFDYRIYAESLSHFMQKS